MTRKILFRGKWTRNGKWIEGFYARIHDGKGNVSHRIYSGYAESDCGDFYPENFEVDPSTVGQFTGLTANGKKIFEGDIISIRCEGDAEPPSKGQIWYENAKIYYSAIDCGWFVNFSDGYELPLAEYVNCNDFTVIGNIHDNPELLEGEG